ncbi:hypothetical protein ACLMJK_003220 [Lecanora helva]
MDTSPAAVARLVIPKVPFLCKTALWHSLWLSPTSSKWDLKTELIIKMIRSILDSPTPTPISKQQKASLKDPGIKGKMWISKVTLPAPGEGDVRDLVMNAVDAFKDGGEVCAPPELCPVGAEWTGYRNVDANRPRLDLSEAQHYQRLMLEVSSEVTILYFHGGAHFMMDPSSHRNITSHLAHLTSGHCLSVRYRLAPQNPFPSALLDAFVAYLSLMYPPPDSYHTSVPPTTIVFSGDSAGGNISLALCQLILQINRSGSPLQTISFHGNTIALPIPLPAGCATISPWLDMTRAMPSVASNAQYDYLPPPITREKASTFPSCEIWPTDPPRGDLYCDTTMLCHQLVSPLAVEDWSGCCPLWFSCGEEMMADEVQIVAAKAAKQGVPVLFEQWEAMPHCFALILLGTPMSKRCFKDWTNFCRRVVKGEDVQTKGLWFQARSQKEREVDVRGLAKIEDSEVKSRMDDARERRHIGLEGEAKILPKLA